MREIKNRVYIALKENFGEYVCDTAVKELRSLKKAEELPGFGGRTMYNDMAEEIIQHISNSDRQSFFDYALTNGRMGMFQSALNEIAKDKKERKPSFKPMNHRFSSIEVEMAPTQYEQFPSIPT